MHCDGGMAGGGGMIPFFGRRGIWKRGEEVGSTLLYHGGQ